MDYSFFFSTFFFFFIRFFTNNQYEKKRINTGKWYPIDVEDKIIQLKNALAKRKSGTKTLVPKKQRLTVIDDDNDPTNDVILIYGKHFFFFLFSFSFIIIIIFLIHDREKEFFL